MEIVPFDPKYFPQMALLYEKVYSSPGDKYDVEKALSYLQADFQAYPQYCFMALENGQCAGAIFCKVIREYDGQLLSIDTIQVEPKFQQMGIGTKLLDRATKEARKNKLDGISFDVDSTRKSLITWYKKTGFTISKDILCYKIFDK